MTTFHLVRLRSKLFLSRVRSLAVSPIDKTFLSASADRTVRVWDLRSAMCQVKNFNRNSINWTNISIQGLILTPGNPLVDYDPDGLAFGVGIDSQIIGLYDIRNHEKVCWCVDRLSWLVSFLQGPFEMLKYECEGDFQWTHLKFSPNGKMILVSTNTSLILLVDAFSGVLLHTFTVNLLFTKKYFQLNFIVEWNRVIRILVAFH